MITDETPCVRDLIIHGSQDPDAPAIESPGGEALTYRDLRKQIAYVARSLNARGFRPNDRIAVIMPAGPETAVITVSLMAGFTCTPLDPHYKEHEFETYFLKLNVKAIIVPSGYETAARTAATSYTIPVIELHSLPGKAGLFELSPPLSDTTKDAEFASPSDIALILQTSGTTASPKIIPITQKHLCKRVQQIINTLKLSDIDRSLHIVPYYHALGIVGTLMAPLFAGGTVICTTDFIPSDFTYILKTCRPTYYWAGPALHQGILREIKKVPPDELKHNSLKYIGTISAAMPSGVLHELELLLGVPVLESYGMSEVGTISINLPGKPGSEGIPIVESLAIMDDNGNHLNPYENGEIAIGGGTVFSGYEDAPEDNATSFTNGWFKTGDTGYLDSEGYLFLTGRKKELINKGGEKISPAEIDSVLMAHPQIKQAMTFRIDDPVLGEEIAAMVVRADGRVSEEDLRRYLLDRLVQYKIPKKIWFVDEIPQDPTGKPLRYVGTRRYSRETGMNCGEEPRKPLNFIND